jgi:IS4 transposase
MQSDNSGLVTIWTHWLPENRRTLAFVTNHIDLGTTTIARVYKDRWQIEPLFKALSQKVHVTMFIRTSATAVHVQISTAVIALIILKYPQFKAYQL